MYHANANTAALQSILYNRFGFFWGYLHVAVVPAEASRGCEIPWSCLYSFL